MCVTEEHPGGRGRSVRPRPAAEGTEPRLCISACGRDRGAAQTSEGATKPGEEECSVPEVKPSGGKILRGGGMILEVICNFSRSLCVSAN